MITPEAWTPVIINNNYKFLYTVVVFLVSGKNKWMNELSCLGATW